MKATWFLPALLVLAGCGAPKNDIGVPNSPGPSAASATPKFSDVLVSDSEDSSDSKTSFTVDTPKVFVKVHFDNVKTGSKIMGTWIADKVEGAPDNTKIDEVTQNVGPLVNTETFSLSKPTKGWPLGEYHVDLSVDGKVIESPKFSVTK